jgi:hypothetical protein
MIVKFAFCPHDFHGAAPASPIAYGKSGNGQSSIEKTGQATGFVLLDDGQMTLDASPSQGRVLHQPPGIISVSTVGD